MKTQKGSPRCFFLLVAITFLLLTAALVFAAPRNVPTTTEAARQYLTDNPVSDDIAGLYKLIKGRFHGAYLILPSTGTDVGKWEYTATALETSNEFEKPGTVKFFMHKNEGRFTGFYFDASLTGKGKFHCQFLTTSDSIIAYPFPSSEPSIFTRFE